jgi:plastocyanin
VTNVPGAWLLSMVALVLGLACGCVRAPLELAVGSAPGDALAFLPDAIGAPAGTNIRITFRNESSQPHNLTFPAPLSAASMTIVEPGMSDVIQLLTPAAGSYRFVCTIHVGMSGTLTVN